MKLQKQILSAAIAASLAGLAAQAQAGNVSATFDIYATEQANLGLTTVNSPNMAYQPGVLIGAGTTFTLYVELKDGAKFNTAAGSKIVATDVSITGLSSGYTVNAVNFNAAKTVAAIEIQMGAATSLISANPINIAPHTGALDLAGATGLKTSGSAVNATFSIVNGTAPADGSSFTTPTSGVVDSGSGIVVKSADAITVDIVASDHFPMSTSIVPAGSATQGVKETQQIDVATALTKFTTGANSSSADKASLGAIVFNEVPGTQKKAGGGDFKLNTDTSNLTFDVSGNFPPSATFGLYSNSSCTTTVPGVTITPNATATEVSFNLGSAPTNNTPYFVCMDVSNVQANGETIIAHTPKMTSVKLLNGTSVAKTAADTDLYPLTVNGTSASLINYVPAAAAPYQTFVRLANNGLVNASTVQVTFIGANGSVLGTGTLNPLAKGASKTYSAAELEAAAGVTLAAGDRPQVKIYANTSDLAVQAYLADPNGGFTNMTFNK